MLFPVLKSICLGSNQFVHKGQTLDGSALPEGRVGKLLEEGFLALPKAAPVPIPAAPAEKVEQVEEGESETSAKSPVLQDANKKRSFVPDSLTELKLKDLNLLVKGIDPTAPVFGVKKAAIDWLTVEFK